MEFKIGDRVKFLNDRGEGKVVDLLKPGWVLVEDREGFAYEHRIEELVPVGNWGKEFEKYDRTAPDIMDVVERNIDQHVARKANEQFKQFYKNKDAPRPMRKGEMMEVDLHIHEIMDRHSNLTNGEIVVIQLEHFERMLRMGEEKKMRRIIFIHGVGQGVLRAEIRKLLTQYYPHCEYLDAPYTEYGYGATEVIIHRR
ncbi:MAG: Smr/MutS family protein [Flavobacteriales bacterium]